MKLEQYVYSFGPELKLDTKIYRVFSHQRLIEMLTDKKLALVDPHLWEDPFENIMGKMRATINGIPNVLLSGVYKNFYGQCRTLNQESDAMWRIYSEDKRGARVITTVGRLIQSIIDQKNVFADMAYLIGSVGYKTEQELKDLYEDEDTASLATFDQQGLGQSSWLFYKREAFAHEAEVRLLYRHSKEDDDNQRPEKAWLFDIDPSALFDDILFDPRMTDADFASVQSDVKRLGYTGGIDRSSLYQFPKLNIKLKTPY